MINQTRSCPFGHKCQQIIDNVVDTCELYETLHGRNSETGEIEDISGCSIRLSLKMQSEQNYSTRGALEAVVSLREETIKRQDAFISLAHQARLGNGKA